MEKLDHLNHLKHVLDEICENIREFETQGYSDGGLQATITNSLTYMETEMLDLRRRIYRLDKNRKIFI